MALTYPTGLQNVLSTWTTAAFGWALFLDSTTPAPSPTVSQVTLADLIGAGGVENTDGAYARQVMTTPSVTQTYSANPALAYVNYLCGAPNFGILSDSSTSSWLVLYRKTGSDATSNIVEVYPINYLANGITSCLISLTNGAALRVATLSPSEYSN